MRWVVNRVDDPIIMYEEYIRMYSSLEIHINLIMVISTKDRIDIDGFEYHRWWYLNKLHMIMMWKHVNKNQDTMISIPISFHSFSRVIFTLLSILLHINLKIQTFITFMVLVAYRLIMPFHEWSGFILILSWIPTVNHNT